MIVKRLSLTNFRGFKQAEMEFKPGVNVIAGVNGAGKSSVLDALRVLVGLVVSRWAKHRAARLTEADVRVGQAAADLHATLCLGETDIDCIVHHNREQYISGIEGEVRSQMVTTPDKYDVSPRTIEIRDNWEPFALYFSPHRSLVTHAGIRDVTSVSATRENNLFFTVWAEALSDRRLNLRTIAEWWLGQLALAQEDSSGLYLARSDALKTALKEFLPEFRAVGPKPGDVATIEIVKGETTLDATQLSDGERGMLALVLETARRLALANPGLENPIDDGEALILIDEIELHLHPTWQREVIDRLQRTFPKCQFIVTTHSPHVIAQVKAKGVTLIEPGGATREAVSTYGLPASEVLESVQGVPPLHRDLIDSLMLALDDLDVERADTLLDQIRAEVEMPNQLVSELETLIGNTRALLDDAGREDMPA